MGELFVSVHKCISPHHCIFISILILIVVYHCNVCRSPGSLSLTTLQTSTLSRIAPHYSPHLLFLYNAMACDKVGVLVRPALMQKKAFEVMQAGYRMVDGEEIQGDSSSKSKGKVKSEGGSDAGETALNAAELLLSVVERSGGMLMMPKQFEK